MKYNILPKAVKLLLRAPIYGCLKKEAPALATRKYRKQVDKEYKAIIKRTEGVGGMKQNPNEMALIMAAYPVAMYKVADGRMDTVLLSTVIDAVCSSKTMKMVSRGDAFDDATIRSREETAAFTQKRQYKNDWLTTFDYTPGSGECFITHTECGICKMAEQEGVFPIIQYMCKMDYPSFEYKGAVLDRTKTLASGDDCCNFHVMTIAHADEIGFVKSPDAK